MAAMAGKAPKAWALPRFQVSICSYNKQPHYEKQLTKNIRPNDTYLENFTKHLVNVLKFTKYLLNVPKFTKYLVNSYHQKDVKHYVLTN